VTEYVLGIDAGGTKTVAAIVDGDGNLAGVGVSGPGNIDGTGIATVKQSLRESVSQAREAAGDISPRVTFAGVAGVLLEVDQERTREMIAPVLGEAAAILEVDHDGRAAFAGGLAGGPGVVLIAGTGTLCFGRDKTGREWRASGWGSLFGDEGSSYWIAIQGVRAALRGCDGRAPATSLGELLFPMLGVTGPEHLLSSARSDRWTRSELAALAPVVIDAAQQGDAAAREVTRRAVLNLTEAVAAVSHHLDFADKPFRVAGVGGLLGSRHVWRALRGHLESSDLAAVLVRPEMPPVLGSALLALGRLHAVEPDKLPVRIIDTMRQAALQIGL
jgi:N-acetylglucosamine kinase-like BadF-type ATPase